MPTISGIAWVGDGQLLCVHDAKAPDHSKPRLGLITVPKSGSDFHWQPVEFHWPGPLGAPTDLESVSRIPGTTEVLVTESGQDKKYHRIFLIQARKRQLQLINFIDWPAPVTNVEGTAVAQVGKRLVFIYAERGGDGKSSTKIRWADLDLKPFKIGSFQEVKFTCPDPTGAVARPVSAIDVDDKNRIYVAAATDPGDNGPFRSVIWRIGKVQAGDRKKVEVVLDDEPERIANVDTLKVEGIAIRQQSDGKGEIFAGSDDEVHGGSMRRVPLELKSDAEPASEPEPEPDADDEKPPATAKDAPPKKSS
jgi:hypothetical protein